MDMSKDSKNESMPEVNKGYVDDQQQQHTTEFYNQPVQKQPAAYYAGEQQPPPSYASQAAQQQSNTNVTVITNQPDNSNKLILGPVYGHRDWTTGLCDCCDEPSECCFTTCCYMMMMWQIGGRMGETGCAPCCVPFFDMSIRTRIRTLGGIQGTMCKDCCVVCWCNYCAACQESRELKNMGL